VPRHSSSLPGPRGVRLRLSQTRRRQLKSLTRSHQTGDVFGQVRRRRTADDLVAFMEAIAESHPAGDVHVVWDNLNIHFDGSDARWTRFNQRHGHRFHFHYTPLHASWVNQVEIFFGILHKRLLRYALYANVTALEEAIRRFLDHWKQVRGTSLPLDVQRLSPSARQSGGLTLSAPRGNLRARRLRRAR